MQIISLIQSKGGSGKTTISQLLASQLRNDGARVFLIDADPRRQLINWCEKGAIDLDYEAVAGESELTKVVEALKELDGEGDSYDLVIIDTAGSLDTTVVTAIAVSNTIIVPSMSDEGSVQSALDTNEYVKRSMKTFGNPGCSVYSVLTCTKKSNIATMARNTLKTYMDVFDSELTDSVGFREIQSTGAGPESSVARAVWNQIVAEMQIRGVLDYYASK